jgi:hypothetical protein
MSSTLSKNIKTYIDGFALLERQRDAIARPSIDLDDPLWLQFILRTKDKSPKIRALLKIVDNYAFDLRSERSQDIRYQIMGERSLRLHALNEQPNSRPNALIYKYHENHVLVAKKNDAAATARKYRADVNFDKARTHTASLVGHSVTPRFELDCTVALYIS